MSPAIPILAAVALVALFSGSGSAAAAPVEPDEGPPPGPGPGPGGGGGAPPPAVIDEGPPPDGGDDGSAMRERAIRDECEGKARYAIDSGDPDVMAQVADEIEGDCPDLAQVLREAADDAASWWGF